MNQNDESGKQKNAPSPSVDSPLLNPNTENVVNNPDLLTKKQKCERILTLLIMAYISFLTGIDYAIIIPTAWGYINTFLENHYGGFVMGLLLSVFSLSGAIGGLLFGYFDDIGVSLRLLVLIATIFKIIGNILYFVGINIYVVVISRLIAGIGMSIVPPLLAEVSRRSTSETRTKLLAKILACRQIGLFLGPCFTIFLKHLNFKLFGIAVTVHNAPGLLMALLWLISFILTIFFFYDSSRTINDQNSIANAFRSYSFGQALKNMILIMKDPVILILLIVSFTCYFNQTTLEAVLTPFTNRQFNWGELQVSILFAVAGVEITIIYIALQFVTKKIRDQTILLAGNIILSVACLIAVVILPFSEVGSTKYLPVFLIFVGLDVFSLPLLSVTSTSLFTQQIRDEHQGIGQGLQRFIVNLATVIGPLYAGILLPHTWLLLIIMFLVIFITTGLILFVYRRFETHAKDELSSLISSANSNSNN